MTDINRRVNALVANFVDEITRLARASAVDTLSRALGQSDTLPRQRAPRSRPDRRVVKANSAARGSGAKRPRAEIAALQARVLSHVRSNPGQRIEQINKILGTRTADLARPIKKLIADGSLTTTGTRRATKYMPGAGSGGKKRHAARGE